ncbi:MAG: hypothetical protein WBV46_18425 [Terriglobales bacterium]|jgi:hypothetical protein
MKRFLGVISISLNVEPATPAASDALPANSRPAFQSRRVVDDPDGNQLLFNYPNETLTPET